MQGFGTGVGQTGLYETGIGVPITGAYMGCPGPNTTGCAIDPASVKGIGGSALALDSSGSALALSSVGPSFVSIKELEDC